VPISQTCGGSRVFALHIVVSWHAGNTVKIDAGSGFEFRSATNANVIVRSTGPTTTVPDVTGVDQGSVAGHLAGSGLTMGTVTRVANPVAAGHVIAQNSPPGTIEPAGSPVDLTISLGVVTVPDLNGDTATQAISELTAVGLATHIEHRAQCVDLGLVIDQTPSAGTSVAPGSTVTITIASGTLHSC
jgi:serine/threonine-protein kinase